MVTCNHNYPTVILHILLKLQVVVAYHPEANKIVERISGVREANSRFLKPLFAVSSTDFQLHGRWIIRTQLARFIFGHSHGRALELGW